jgi:hypothetical protein
MNPLMLFRASLAEHGEMQIAKKYFNVVESRMFCSNQLVVGRYSVLPFYGELENDLRICGGKLINSYEQHQWIANFGYYTQLKDYTFESWFDDDIYECKHPGPFVVKGKTNSKKMKWDTHMFAKDRDRALEIASDLFDDPLISSQGIVYRKYEPLRRLGTGLSGLPFTNEWRLFYYGKKLLSHGFYWTMADERPGEALPLKAFDFAQKVVDIASQYVNFFVVDIAEKADGSWVMVELNDGQMSGLSENNADVLYQNLKLALEK